MAGIMKKNLDLEEMITHRELEGKRTSMTQRDASTQWHPYTQMKDFGVHLPVVSARGSRLFLEDGSFLIDAISSWWVNLYGHGNPIIKERLTQQFDQLDHVLFAGFTHPPALELADRLLPLLPGMSRLFFSDNGSTAVEVALKMALQYFWNRGEVDRRVILAFENAYHGDTFGAMAAGGVGVFNQAFADMLPKVIRIPVPLSEDDPQTFEALEKIDLQTVAGFIYEPLVQGAGGMIRYDADGLSRVMSEVHHAGGWCIADEVMTGFGRLDTFFASEVIEEKPDIICLSKGLTGGVLPMAISAASERVYEGFLSNDRGKAFMHGHSFTANPMGCAAALAGLDLLNSEEIQRSRLSLIRQQADFASSVMDHPNVEECFSIGTLLVIRLKRNRSSEIYDEFRDRVYALALANQVLLRPLGNVLYAMPPYTSTTEDLKIMYKGIRAILNNIAID